jgi:hypothetical protein
VVGAEDDRATSAAGEAADDVQIGPLDADRGDPSGAEPAGDEAGIGAVGGGAGWSRAEGDLGAKGGEGAVGVEVGPLAIARCRSPAASDQESEEGNGRETHRRKG